MRSNPVEKMRGQFNTVHSIHPPILSFVVRSILLLNDKYILLIYYNNWKNFFVVPSFFFLKNNTVDA
tara:strand:+ start:709 stop:909 length:201 start_codon:yes stop_codon:yes gene_type:complete